MAKTSLLQRLAKRWHNPKYPKAETLSLLLLGSHTGKRISGTLPIWARRFSRVDYNTFMAAPATRQIFRIPYKVAKSNFGLTRREYNALLAHELGHMRDWKTVFASVVAPSLTTAAMTVGAHRLLRVHPYLAAPVASAVSRVFVGNPLAYLAEMHADKAAVRKYGKDFISGLKKLEPITAGPQIDRLLKRQDLPKYQRQYLRFLKNLYEKYGDSMFVDPHTSIPNRIRRAKRWMQDWGMS